MNEFPGLDDRKKNVAASEFRVRARFYAIRQVDGERVYDWYRRVREAAVPCGFGVVHQPQCSPVTDKFVTGLRPGPVADRLLGERADCRLDVLLAAAVEAEVAAAVAAAAVGNDDDGARRSAVVAGAEAGRLSAGRASPELLAEIREGLKLYRYSGDGHERGLVGGGGGDDDPSNDYKHKSQMSNVKMTGNMKSTLDGKSWWKHRIEKNDYIPQTCNNCCKLATKLLDNFQENTHLYHHPSTSISHEKRLSDNYKSSSYYHDDSKCYCSLLANNCKVKNVTAIGVGKSKNVSISNCLDSTKNINCCFCNLNG